MAELTLYVPHRLGRVIGERRPFLAASTAQAIAAGPASQPMFVEPAAAFDWLHWARSQNPHRLDLSIAHITVSVDLESGQLATGTTLPGLADPANQILRATPTAPGPDAQLLTACYRMGRAAAARTWLVQQVGAASTQRIAAALHTIWGYGYPVAARDTRAALAGHIASALATAVAGTDDDAAHDELARLNQAAATLAAAAAICHIPDPPADVIDAARASLRRDGELGGWDTALAHVWQQALRISALDSVVGAATDIQILWRAGSRDVTEVRIGDRDAPSWVAAMLTDANRTVAGQWLHASAAIPAPVPSEPVITDDPDLTPAHRPARPFPRPGDTGPAEPDRPPHPQQGADPGRARPRRWR